MYEKWAYVRYGKKCMRNTYIRALKTIRETEQSSECLGTNLNEIGVRKLATIFTLPIETRNQLIENAPPEKMTIIYNLKQIHKTLKNQLIMIFTIIEDNTYTKTRYTIQKQTH